MRNEAFTAVPHLADPEGVATGAHQTLLAIGLAGGPVNDVVVTYSPENFTSTAIKFFQKNPERYFELIPGGGLRAKVRFDEDLPRNTGYLTVPEQSDV